MGWIHGKNIRLHRYILQILGYDITGLEVDHIDGNPLNNQTDNLRLATRSQNARNREAQSNNTSGFKGVFWHKSTSKWMVKITCEGKQHYGGVFEDKLEAHHAAVALREKLHKEFANHGTGSEALYFSENSI